ncbi:hypothetical protein [Pseudoalteromonas sp. SWN166]|nr:hypothetical protein [Pseudoalteromonas sp. SWN166]
MKNILLFFILFSSSVLANTHQHNSQSPQLRWVSWYGTYLSWR